MNSWFKSPLLALALLANAFFVLAQPSKEQKLTIMSYNIQNYFIKGEKTDKPQNAKDASRVQAVHDIIIAYKPDIIAIQEIGGPKALQYLQQSLAKRGLELPYRLLYTGIDRVRQQALLSKYPIIENHSKPYWSYKLNNQKLLMNRGIVDVEIQTPLGLIRCLAVHLKSQRFSSIAHQKDIRYQETLLLKKHIEGILEKQAPTTATPLIVLGDFNDTINSEPIKLIKSIKDPHSNKTALYPGYSLTNSSNENSIWTHYWAYQGIYSKFDYIWMSSNCKKYKPMFNLSAINNSLLASDHRACLIQLSAN